MGCRLQEHFDHSATNVVPVLFLLSSLGIVVYAAGDQSRSACPCHRHALIAIARSAYAFRQLRALADSRREARTDELTGLPNRRLFFESLAACLESEPKPRLPC